MSLPDVRPGDRLQLSVEVAGWTADSGYTMAAAMSSFTAANSIELPNDAKDAHNGRIEFSLDVPANAQPGHRYSVRFMLAGSQGSDLPPIEMDGGHGNVV